MKKSDLKPINGLLLLNKHQGLSSNAILQRVKWLYQAKKLGHTGSLDPLATGMLPLCFGEATKFCQYLLDADKSYLATGMLGVKTDTADAEGHVIQKETYLSITNQSLETVLNGLIGNQNQIPPMYSALKHQGQPLYKLAREGVSIERKERAITIYSIKLVKFDDPFFTIEVTCSKGTYIRSLVETIGEQLGTCAHVTKLHRIHTAGFANEPMYSFDQLSGMSHEMMMNCLLPMDRIVNYLPQMVIDDEQIGLLRQGKPLDILQADINLTRLYSHSNEFIGLGTLFNNQLLVKRLISF